ncbi:MAG: cyclic nucleotide-binding domain-containing protein [Thermodesulfobacteriota bacterium]|nr:cyclic nucleotide-binding domain-containing protein [Thermodesulfobacteriota bacterium]
MKETKIMQEGKIKKTITDFLVDIPLFDKLNPEELKIIAKQTNLFEFKKGENVFAEGDQGNYVCFVVDGILDVIKESMTGDSVVITALSRGRSIGEMSVIDNFPRSATVKARTDATLLILTRKSFDLILEEHSEVGIKILKGLSRLLSLNLRKTSGRLADYMLPVS